MGDVFCQGAQGLGEYIHLIICCALYFKNMYLLNCYFLIALINVDAVFH